MLGKRLHGLRKEAAADVEAAAAFADTRPSAFAEPLGIAEILIRSASGTKPPILKRPTHNGDTNCQRCC